MSARSKIFAYNLADALTSETYPSGRIVTTGYDGANRTLAVTGNLGGVVTKYVGDPNQQYGPVNYWPHGEPYYYSYGNGLTHAASFNARLQPTESYDALNNTNSSSQMLFVSCPNWGDTSNPGVYDLCPHPSAVQGNGSLLAYDEYHGGTGYSSFLSFHQSFTYDGGNRLLAAADTGWERHFGYDQHGNMWLTKNTGVPLAGNTPTSNVYSGATNRVNGGSYDAVGNQTVVNGDTLTYDAENRLISATEPNSTGGATQTYSYDGNGQRVQKTVVNGATTVYVYDAFGQVAAQYGTASTPAACQTCYLSYDHLGSLRMVTDASGQVIARHDYLPFGEEIPANTAGRDSDFGANDDNVAQRFTGQERDSETGLDYFHARYFGAAQGRFTSPDPANAGADLFNPQTWNGYAYVRNNPLNLIDPSGMADDTPTFSASTSACHWWQFWCYLGGGESSGGSDWGSSFGGFSGGAGYQVTVQPPPPRITEGATTSPPNNGNPAATQPCFNTASFASTLDQNACPASKGQCARYVRLALQGGGINTTGRPDAAGDYGPFLESKGFLPVSVQGYKPQMGDIAIFGKTDVHPYGHVTGFDGVKWVSDFIQKHMNPYKAPATAGPLTLYKNPNPCGG